MAKLKRCNFLIFGKTQPNKLKRISPEWKRIKNQWARWSHKFSKDFAFEVENSYNLKFIFLKFANRMTTLRPHRSSRPVRSDFYLSNEAKYQSNNPRL